jgi:hypothetical protein
MSVILYYTNHDEDYFKKIIELLKKERQEKICYITLDKTAGFLSELFEKNNFKKENIYFVDCISGLIKELQSTKHCDFISEPYNLNEIESSVKKFIGKGCNLVLFDSLSSLMAYGLEVPAGTDILKRFINSFLPLLKEKNGNAIFLCKKKDKEKVLILETLDIFEEIKEV